MFNEKSNQSAVIGGELVIVNPCNCVTCGQQYMVTIQQTKAILIVDNQLVSYQLPKNFHCPNCNSTYIRWSKLPQIHSIK